MTLGVFSTMTGLPWGGSEQLWSRAALRLLEQGHDVAVNYKRWPSTPDPLRRLRDQGATLTLRRPRGHRSLPRRVVGKVSRHLGRSSSIHQRWLANTNPDAVLINAGWHLDDFSIAGACRKAQIPYAIMLQCAGRHYWSGTSQAATYQAAYEQAETCFFLSEDNQRIVETVFACNPNRPAVVDNPINVDPAEAPSWPSSDDGWRLACVGRLHCKSKGQDLILDCLRQHRWRSRPLHVTFYGQNQDSEERLHQLVEMHDLSDLVTFAGYQPLSKIWDESHALLLPSRYEGMPMATLEAMLWGRPAIVTDCGRNGQFVDDGDTGFLLPAATTDLLDEAMERAWKRRHDWRDMGRLATERVPERYGSHPVDTFVDHLNCLLQGS
jgi:glycosyltransferase involved in cell wall biosynthesis